MGVLVRRPAAILPLVFAYLVASQGLQGAGGSGGGFNYKEALSKSLVFLEAQRSGKLPDHHRPSWRGDSALDDGKLANVDLVGGYYDAGDNVKYTLPMAFTITTLSWAALAYKAEMEAAGELDNAHAAIRWGTDYFLKASSRRNRLYVQVGDAEEDHKCWVRPENMNTPRTVLKIDQDEPGTEIAAETAAAMAAASIVFRRTDHKYSRRLLNKAKLLYLFAKSHQGSFDKGFRGYASVSGYDDEMLWATTWLYLATRRASYMKAIKEESKSAPVGEFSWDLKYAGAQIILSGFSMSGEKGLEMFRTDADAFVCMVLPDSPYRRATISPGGLINLRDGANTQYPAGIAFLLFVYGDLLEKHHQKVVCGDKEYDSSHLRAFAKQQIDYLLGDNPQRRSYMVGFGNNPPTQPHHRGASVPELKHGEVVNCGMSFAEWFNKDAPNPFELTGAIVGGPDHNDNFVDKRSDSSKLEPCTYINSVAAGALARLAYPRP